VNRGMVGLVLVLAGATAACGSDAPSEPTTPEPLVYDVGGFRIEDATRQASTGLVDSIAAALGAAVTAVTGFLPEFTLPDDTITFRLLEGGGIPYVTTDQLLIVQWNQDLALEYLPHQVTHLLTGYQRRVFLEEGIAVYATEVLDPTSTITNPYRGQSSHAWVSLFEQSGSTIPLASAFAAGNLVFSYTGSSSDASAWQLFIEAASFTRWVFAVFGRDAWLQLYESNDLATGLGSNTLDLERAWLTAVRDSYPNPLSCEEALGTRGPLTTREQFWCARARGE